MAKEVHVIYTIAGNLPYVYDPVKWKYENKEYYEPLLAIALAKHLSKKGKKVELKILVPHSVFINQDENLENLEKLEDTFKVYIFSYFKKKYEALLTGKKPESFLSFLESAIFNTTTNKAQLQEIYQEIQLVVNSNEKLDKKLELIINIFKEKLTDLIEKINEEYKNFLEKAININVEIIPSYGIYKGKFILDYRPIQVYERILYNYLIFIEDLLKFVKKNGEFFIYLDTSIGSNTFLVEALEAFNSAITFWNFYFLGEKKNKGKFYILSAEPVIGSPNPSDVKHFSIEPINRIAFFEKPLTWKDFKENIQGNLDIEDKQLEDAVKEGIYLFNVIKYNLPLALFINPPDKKPVEYLSEDKIIEIIRHFIEKNKPNFEFSLFNGNHLQVKLSYNFNTSQPSHSIFMKIRNMTFLLMLYASLVKAIIEHLAHYFKKKPKKIISSQYNKLLIKADINNMNRYILDNKLKESLTNLFKAYKLYINIVFLDKEWQSKNKDLSKFCKKLFFGECKLLCKFENRDPGDITKRNFLAHLGFESNITQLCYDGKKYFLSYDKNRLKDIYEFILNDEFKTLEEENENQSNN